MSIQIGFTGDFCPWQRTEARYFAGEWIPDFNPVRSFFQNNHLNIADLECPLTRSEKAIPKTGPHLKAAPETADILKYLNIGLVATANNHFYDYGWEGMQSTFEALSQAGIRWLGSGANLEEASRIHYQDIEGMTFAFLNLAENEWSTTQGIGPGVNPLDPVEAYRQIQEAKGQADFIVVVAHGGHEHYALPSPRMKQLYRFFVEAGASAVISHHTHTISGFEVYQGAPIFYSLGNFCFDWPPGQQQSPWNTGMLVQLIFEKDKVLDFKIHLVKQNDGIPGVRFLDSNEYERKMLEVKALNQTISDDQALEDAFSQYCNSQEDLLLTWIEPYSGKYLAGARKKGLLPSLFSKQKKRLLTNLIRCEAHRDVLLNALKSDLK